MKKTLTGLAVSLLFASFAWSQDIGEMPASDPPVFALKGATVHTGSGAVLEGATVVIRDGLIEAVGVNAAIPADARVIDASKLHVYPGLIDALSEAGLASETRGGPGGARPGGGGGFGGQQAAPQPDNNEGPGLYSYVRAGDLLGEGLEGKVASWREAGVLTANIAPTEGIFMGQSAVVNLGGSDADSMIVKSPVFMRLSYQGMRGRTYPGSLMGVLAHIRQTFLDTQHYKLAQSIYERNPRGLHRPETDRALEALVPTIDGAMPVVFPAKRAREVRRALAMASDFHLDIIVAGGFEADQTLDELKGARVPVLFSLDLPTKPRDQHPEAEETLEALKLRVDSPKVPAKLKEAGIPFAFYSDGANARDYMSALRKVVEKGLSEEDALRAATLSAAEILGVDQQLGSIEKGKIANLVVADKDLFDESAKVRHVFVDGRKFDIPVEARRGGGPRGRGGNGNPSGRWDVTVTAPEGNHAMQFVLQRDGRSLTGRVESPEVGTLDIYDATSEGSSFSFKVTVDLGSGPLTLTFSGTVSGETLTGTADLEGEGSAPMEGKRVPGIMTENEG